MDTVRSRLFSMIALIVRDLNVSSFHILVKGTSNAHTYKLFTGLPLIAATNIENNSIHAYSIRAFQTITKVVNGDGTITEIPSFNNIFDAVESIEELAELKKCLVPITAEEFYNLDDLK